MWPGASLDVGDEDGDDVGVDDGFGDGFVDAVGDDVGFGDDLCGVLLAVAGTDAGVGCADACAAAVSNCAARRRDCASTNFDPGGCLRSRSACSSCNRWATSLTPAGLPGAFAMSAAICWCNADAAATTCDALGSPASTVSNCLNVVETGA